jgi:hypothetical protein
MVKLELGKRDFVWIGLIVVLIGIGFVYAYGGSEPSVMGHSAEEIDFGSSALSGCDEGEYLKFESGEWACSSSVSSNCFWAGNEYSEDSECYSVLKDAGINGICYATTVKCLAGSWKVMDTDRCVTGGGRFACGDIACRVNEC